MNEFVKMMDMRLNSSDRFLKLIKTSKFSVNSLAAVAVPSSGVRLSGLRKLKFGGPL